MAKNLRQWGKGQGGTGVWFSFYVQPPSAVFPEIWHLKMQRQPRGGSNQTQRVSNGCSTP